MSARTILFLSLLVTLSIFGCRNAAGPAPNSVSSPSTHDLAVAANKAFLNQKSYDPWVLTNTDPSAAVPAYLADGRMGYIISGAGAVDVMQAGDYQNNALLPRAVNKPFVPPGATGYSQVFDMQHGTFTTQWTGPNAAQSPFPVSSRDWSRMWQTSDIIIQDDAQAQQVIHANLFSLLSSIDPKSANSVPPMGLSSGVYSGHIFWDSDVWMLPALIVQHPEYAKPIVDYRSARLAQAKKNAQADGLKGAEYPWESAGTGKEVAPPEFAKERHITADVAFAAWQYYLWTGNAAYLKNEGWPLLSATAQYWVSRVTKETDGKYHIKGVLSPDETAGVVDDDAYTNSVVKYNLLAAAAAAPHIGAVPDPRWKEIADALFLPMDRAHGIIAENSSPMTDRFSAKQADTLLLVHPLGFATDTALAGKMLDFYAAHTNRNGPAMTSSIEAIVAAKLGRASLSLELFHDSYQPFMRAPWDAFSEKRTTDNVYFLTGMAGCAQSVLYGFAGLQAVSPWDHGTGTKLAADGDVALYCEPHLPPGWGALTIKGIQFRGQILDVAITSGNQVSIIHHGKTSTPSPAR